MFHIRSVTALALVAVGTAVTVALPVGGLRAAEPEPTAIGELLADSVGEWEGTMTITRPGMPQMELKATETVVAVGRSWTVSDLRCDIVGQPFHAHLVFGEDEVRKKLVATRIDSMNGQMALMGGRYDEKTKIVHMSWTAKVAGIDEPVTSRYELKYAGDTYVMRFYEGQGADELSTMRIEMHRKLD